MFSVITIRTSKSPSRTGGALCFVSARMLLEVFVPAAVYVTVLPVFIVYADTFHFMPVVAVAYCTAYGEHDFFVCPVEGANGCRVFTTIIAKACRKGKFVVRIEFQRMQGCQSRCPCDAFPHIAVHTVYLVAQTVDGVAVGIVHTVFQRSDVIGVSAFRLIGNAVVIALLDSGVAKLDGFIDSYIVNSNIVL